MPSPARTGARDSGDAAPRRRSGLRACRRQPRLRPVPEQAPYRLEHPRRDRPRPPGRNRGQQRGQPSREPGDPEDDSVQGLAMLVNFTGAVLFVTGAVALLALVGSGWMLGVAFAIHAAMTAVVMLTIVHVMAGPRRAIRVGDRPSPTPTRRSGHRADLVRSAWSVCSATTADGCGPRPRRIGTSGAGASTQGAIVGGVHPHRLPSVTRRGSRPKRKGLRGDTACSWSPTRTWPRRTRFLSRSARSSVRRRTSTSSLRPCATRLQSLTGDIDRAHGCRRPTAHRL